MENYMIRQELTDGIRMLCAKNKTSIVAAAAKAGVGKSIIYRYIEGKSDAGINKLDKFCRDGLGRTLTEVAELGK